MCNEKVPHRTNRDHRDWPLNPAEGGLQTASLRKNMKKGTGRVPGVSSEKGGII